MKAVTIILVLSFWSMHIGYADAQAVCHRRHVGRGGRPNSITCENVGSDGRSLNEVLFRQTINSIGIMSGQRNITDFADHLEVILVKSVGGNISIDGSQFELLPHLRELKIEGNQGGQTKLDISPDAFVNAPSLYYISLSFVIITANTVALGRIKDRLSHLRIDRCEPHEKILEIVFTCTKLEHLTLNHGFFPYGITPGSTFRNSAASLKQIGIWNWNLSTVTADMFSDMPLLKIIYVSHCSISQIERGAFDQAPNLTHVDLSNNPLQHLPDGLFSRNKKLRRVSIRDTVIDNLSADNFTHIDNCEEFELNWQPAFPEGNYRTKEARDCTIRVDIVQPERQSCHMDSPWEYCSVFMSCSLKSNNLSLDQALRQNRHRNIAQACHQHNFDEVAHEITAIWITSAHDGNITIPENGLAGLRNAKLFMVSNVFFGDPQPKEQIYLDMPSNELTKNMPNVVLLEAADTRFTNSAMQAFANQERSVTRLEIRNCTPSKELLGMVSRFSKLEHLRLVDFPDLGQSPIEVFRKSAPTLKKITIDKWIVSKIESATFRGLRNLETLVWDNSRITEIEPGSFDDLVNLKSLNMNNNRILQLPNGLFEKTMNLTFVSMSYNGLVNLSRDNFTHIPTLEHLWIFN